MATPPATKPARRIAIRKLRWVLALAGAVMLSLAGWLFSRHRIGDAVRGLSFDLPQLLSNEPIEDVRIVYMDDHSARELGQPYGVWQRSIHAQLLDRLRADGARAVFFDLVWYGASPDPDADATLAAAMRASGNVFLGGGLELEESEGGATERAVPPFSPLRKAAAGWGLVAFRPVDADYGVRLIYAGTDQVPSATWRLAAKLGAKLPPEDDPARADGRWVRYYGPAGSFPGQSYAKVLQPDGVPPGYFRDKVVFVGGRSTTGTLGLGKDDFLQPHTRFTNQFAPGVEVHATIFRNLWRGEWLRRLDGNVEMALVLLTAGALGLVLPRLRPWTAAGFAVGWAVLFCVAGVWMVWSLRVWFSWGVVSLVLAPMAFTWNVLVSYFLVDRRRRQLQRNFSLYVSPHMVEKIAESDLDMTPGGRVVDATVLFTDLAGFTALSEQLKDPQLLSEVLTDYFTRTTSHVLANDGTIVKYIGDAVLAVWGAPLPDATHAAKAARAVLGFQRDASITVDGRTFRTRAGLHTGRILAGNLGSAQRFDYTVIGDDVNFASRLEGLNKELRTSILISDATRSKLGPEFISRPLGRFRVVGKTEALAIHELLGEGGEPPGWCDTFRAALAAFASGDFPAAGSLFGDVLRARAGDDGPSAFYLGQLDAITLHPPSAGWDGVIELKSK
jgi:adenylate cyclase